MVLVAAVLGVVAIETEDFLAIRLTAEESETFLIDGVDFADLDITDASELAGLLDGVVIATVVVFN